MNVAELSKRKAVNCSATFTYFPDRPDGTTAFCKVCPKGKKDCFFLQETYDMEFNGLDWRREKEFWAEQGAIRSGQFCSFPKPRIRK